MPRAADAPWRRRRFGRPKWFTWAWAAAAIASVAILAAAAVRFARRQYDSSQQRSINQLVTSSRSQENAGHLDQALIDLDAALDLASKAGPAYSARMADWREKRKELARRDAENFLHGLRQSQPASFPLGNWLNLIARVERDPDLSPLSVSINEQFQIALDHEVESALAAARTAFDAGRVVSSFDSCDRIARLLDHFPPDRRPIIRNETEKVVTMLVSTHGVMLEPPQGHFIFGAKSYLSELMPVVVKALEARGYLPRRESSPWRDQWKHALYQLSLDVSEEFEGHYLSSANRLTRIYATVTLAARGQSIWHTTPTVRTIVPLPKLPAYLSTRSGDQSGAVGRV